MADHDKRDAKQSKQAKPALTDFGEFAERTELGAPHSERLPATNLMLVFAK